MMNLVRAAAMTLLFASSCAMAAAHQVTFTLAPDSSSALARAMLYGNQKEFGSNYKLTYVVSVPGFNESPKADSSNRAFVTFTRPDSDSAQGEWSMNDTTIESDKTQNPDTFIMKGAFAYQQINAISDALKESAYPLATDSLWEHEVSCEENEECKQEFTLYSHIVSFGQAQKVPQVYCTRLTGLKNPDGNHPKLERKDYASEEAYLDAQILKQMASGERGAYLQECAYFAAYSDQAPLFQTNYATVSDFNIQDEDLKTVSYYSEVGVGKEKRGELSRFQRLAFNRFQSDLWLRAFKNKTLAEEGLEYALALDDDRYEQDPRMIPAYNAAAKVVYPLLDLFPKYRKNIKIFIHMLTLIPDPDRWFIIGGLASIVWKVVPPETFKQLLPKQWRNLGDQVASYRQNKVIYVNQGFLDADYLEANTLDTFEDWLLFEAFKLWIPSDKKFDFDLFGQKFSRTLTMGNLDEFRTKDPDHFPGLRFVDLISSFTKAIQATSVWPWNAANEIYGATVNSNGLEVRTIAPYLISEVGGTATDTFSTQYKRAEPGNLNRQTRVQATDQLIFCKKIGTRFPAQVKMIAQGAQFVIRGTQMDWQGIKTIPGAERIVTLPSAETCLNDLWNAEIKFRIDSSLEYALGGVSLGTKSK